MNRTEYRKTSRFIRTTRSRNGRYVASVMDGAVRAEIDRLMRCITARTDWLAERADLAAECARKGFACNFRTLVAWAPSPTMAP